MNSLEALLDSSFPYRPENAERLVVLGMSGGVDSSLCAFLLKRQGYRVVGLFMKNWEELDEFGVCQSARDFADVEQVCSDLDIPCYSVDFVEEYREQVFSHFVEEYRQGFTPNPDILCNREIKFKVFFDHAMKLGADFLATGHYCQNMLINGRHRLVKGIDPGKDQTYFLYTMKEEVLKKVLFPLGGLLKSQVRELAHYAKIATSEKKDSTGICFIGERNFKPFLSQYLAPKKGAFISVTGEIVGQHDGHQFYTIGQRKGLGLGGQGAPWFVVGKNPASNEVVVVRGEEHPALFADDLEAFELSFVNDDAKNFLSSSPLFAKNRYRQADQEVRECRVIGDDRLFVSFVHPQRALTPRQSIVFYIDMEGQRVCLGGGMIESVAPSYYARKAELPSTLGT
jgi:tRNA-uridine 2-sulfurtransferase